MVGAWRAAVLAAAALLATLPPLAAQQPSSETYDTLSLALDEALTRAARTGQEVRMAEAGVDAASSRLGAARSARFPQLSSSLVFTKTFASVFQGSGFEIPDSLKFEPNPDVPLEERLAYLEDKTPMAGLAGLGQLFSDMPFGQENAYLAGLTGSHVLYSGGRVSAGIRMAEAGLSAAEEQLHEDRAQVELDVTRAYYQAVLARELLDIAEAALDQADAFLEQERLRFGAGRASELDVLRAEVQASNLRPRLIEARNATDLTALDLKRLVDVPMDQPLRLTTSLELADGPSGPAPPTLPPDAVARARPAVVALERLVTVREQEARLARAAFLPTVALQMNYMRQAFPTQPLRVDADWRTDWTGSLVVDFPLFSGGRRDADLHAARAEAGTARLRLRQLQEAVELEYRQALGERERARSEIDARQRTVEMAARVHDLTVLRYERGLGTQIEVSEARIDLMSARTHLARALADYRIAEATVLRSLGGHEAARRLGSGNPGAP